MSGSTVALQRDINNLDSQIDEKFDPKKILHVVHNIEDTITSLDDSKQSDDNKDLLQAIRSFGNLIRKIVKKLQNLEDQEETIKRLERQCHDLQEKCMELEKKCTELERKYTELDKIHERAREKELKLMAGQLAFEIEKSVTSKVLSGIIIEGYQHINTIYENGRSYQRQYELCRHLSHGICARNCRKVLGRAKGELKMEWQAFSLHAYAEKV